VYDTVKKLEQIDDLGSEEEMSEISEGKLEEIQG
jgi:hypothetical protein